MRYGGKEAAAAPSLLLLSSGASPQTALQKIPKTTFIRPRGGGAARTPAEPPRSEGGFDGGGATARRWGAPHCPPSPSTLLPQPGQTPLTLYVSVQRHHPGPLRAAEGRVVNVIRERGRDAGGGRSRGRHRVLGGVFFMAGSAVLKPNLKQKQQTLCQRRDNWMEVFHQDPAVGVSAKYLKKKESNLEICALKRLTSVPPASRALFYTHESYGSVSSDIKCLKWHLC